MTSDIVLGTSITAAAILKSEMESIRNGTHGTFPSEMVKEIEPIVDDLREKLSKWQKELTKSSE